MNAPEPAPRRAWVAAPAAGPAGDVHDVQVPLQLVPSPAKFVPARALPVDRPAGLEAGPSALAAARRVRATALVNVRQGRWDLDRLIDEAVTVPGHPLRRLRLGQVLAAVPGNGPVTVERTLRKIREVCGEPTRPFTDMTVSWLLDRRSGGRRYLAWLDAATRRAEPWPGWPFTPQPAQRGRAA